MSTATFPSHNTPLHSLHRQTLEMKEKVFGEEHPSTLASMTNFAIVLQQQGKYEEAEQMHRQTLNLSEKVLEGARDVLKQ